jgi:hypothetical protein
MRVAHPSLASLSLLAGSLMLVACTASSEKKPMTGAAGAGQGTAGTGASAGATASGTAGSGSGTAGSGTAGTIAATGTAGDAAGGSVGTAGATGAGTAGSTTGTAGSGTDGGAGSSNKDGSAQLVDGAPVTTAGCANHNYALCMDFESPVDTTVWTGGNPAAIETTEVAHGTHAYHLYSDQAAAPKGGVFTTAKLGALKDQIWGRFYIHFKPGAPGGHGNLIAASDGVWANGNYNGNWYEIGWQFDGIMGVFHTTSGERPLRSKPYLVDQWYCVELFFDGSVKGNPQWWIDGAEAQYYTPQAGVCCAPTNPTTPASVLIPQFKSITVGWTPYAGLGLMLPDQTKIVDTRVLTDAWIDDVAFDTQRIGCIQ